MKRLILIGFGLLLAGCGSDPQTPQAPDAPDAATTTATGTPIDIGRQITLESAVLGETRTLMIHLPPGYEAGSAAYPVLYMTDARSQFHQTVGNIRFLTRIGRMPDVILVAIVNTDRNRDLTPPWSAPAVADYWDPADVGTGGGADTFIRFIETELIPHIEATYRTQPYRLFAGHSFGGLFAVHLQGASPDLFDAIIAVSPSLWWDNHGPVDAVRALFADRKVLNSAFFMTVGDEGPHMMPGFDALRDTLADHVPAGFRWAAKQMMEEDHGSIVLRSHFDGLQFVFDGWGYPFDRLAEGLAPLEAHYAALSERIGFDLAVPEVVMNRLGYFHLGGNPDPDFDAAITVFKRNVAMYPGSANVYDSLAEAQETAGDLAAAAENYAAAAARGAATGDVNLAFYRTNLARVTKAMEDTATD